MATNYGPLTGSIHSYLADGSNLFTGTNSGIFLSTDDGLQVGIDRNNGLPVTCVYSIV